MTRHYRWDTTLSERRHHLAQMRKQQELTETQVAAVMGVSQARVSRMEQRGTEAGIHRDG